MNSVLVSTSNSVQGPTLNFVLAMENVKSLEKYTDDGQMSDSSVTSREKHNINISKNNSPKVSTRLDQNFSDKIFCNKNIVELKITIDYW